jgi:glycosyltransferase involved in cell wall biosynthesis
LVYDISDHGIARSLRADVWLSWWNGPGSKARGIARTLLGALGIRKLLDRATPTRSWDGLRFKRIYFCSAFMRDFTASRNWPVGHAHVIHCGIDTTAFSVKPSHERFNRLLWVGRMNDDKDPFTAIRALAEVHKRGLTDLTLDLYGGGTSEDLARVDAEISSLGLADHVQRRSAPADEMRALYSRYDALLFTSNWGEPFALTPLEAGASGLPVISSLDGGQAELVKDAVNSIMAAAGDPVSYANAIVRLHADPNLRASIAANAFEAVRTNFDIAPITRQIESFLLESLQEHTLSRTTR